ncbi:MAG: guanylate kinase [Endomicrobium sp.]|nr:guanylate kinase [Endomicrobium sp.]
MNNFTGQRGKIIIISAPSGAGKTTVCNAIVKNNKNIVRSISYTTRPPRKCERNAREYFFINESDFEKMIKKNKFIEWAKVHGNYYGTSKDFLKSVLKTDKKIILGIDVQGGINIKKRYPNSCMIFVMTPNLKILKERLTMRGNNSENEIKIRLKNAREELKQIVQYEYLIINRDLDTAVNEIEIVIKSLAYKINN